MWIWLPIQAVIDLNKRLSAAIAANDRRLEELQPLQDQYQKAIDTLYDHRKN